jgi:hypothetical protein
MRGIRFPHRRRPWLALGAVAACAITAAAAAPAYAGATAPSAARPLASYASARVSGHTVAGAVFGAAAGRAAGSAAAHFLAGHRSMLAQLRGAAQGVSPDKKLHAWWGSFPKTNSGPGVIATQSISATLRLSDPSDILYAPTMTPADNSCIEVVTVHTTHTPQIWAWDWCVKIAPVAVVNVTPSFMSTYTAIINGRTSYTTKDVRTNAKTNTWTAYLFNYKTGSWDTLWSQAGHDRSGLSFGWDMFEFYSSTNPATGSTYVCGDLQAAGTQVESSSIAVRHGHQWNLASPANTMWNPEAKPNPASYLCPDMQFNIVQRNSAWMVDVSG